MPQISDEVSHNTSAFERNLSQRVRDQKLK